MDHIFNILAVEDVIAKCERQGESRWIVTRERCDGLGVGRVCEELGKRRGPRVEPNVKPRQLLLAFVRLTDPYFGAIWRNPTAAEKLAES